MTFCLSAALFTAKAQNDTITMDNDQFQPATLTITAGQTVVWKNIEAAEQHTSTSGTSCTSDGTWDSGPLSTGQTFSRMFTSAGTFPYFCSFHCASANMVGTIIVTPVQVNEQDAAVLKVKNPYPNPSGDYTNLDISLTEATSVSIEVYDVTGTKVLTVLDNEKRPAGDHSFVINEHALTAGLYMCRITCGTHSVTKLLSKL